MKRVRLTAALLVLGSTIGLSAMYHSFSIGGNNDPGNGNLGLWADASITSDPMAYPHGPTYIKVRLDGFLHGYQCAYGSFDEGSGWCADNSHYSFPTYRSEARVVMNVVPFGCYTATMMGWVNGFLEENYPIGHCFPDPPSLPGDGYCVSYDFDQGQGDWVCNQSPILIATGKVKRYDLQRNDRVLFDIDADGVLDQVAWTKQQADLAFLALDRNHNGQIDNGAELFGNHTLPGVGNGFQALRQLAGVSWGSVDAAHGGDLFAQLLLWHDRNQNGVSEPEELAPAAATLEAIGLGYQGHARVDKDGNDYRFRSWARGRGPGSRESREFEIFDVFLRVGAE